MMDELVEQCRQNNRKAQEKLYRLLFEMMHRAARKYCQHEHDIISVVNDGYLKACKNIQQFEPSRGSFEAWLHTIITHTALDHLRKQRIYSGHSPIEKLINITDNSHLQVIKPEYLQRLIWELPRVTRSVLSLNMDGFTHREIAAMLRISEVASRRHLSDAKKKLRSRLHPTTARCDNE